MRATPFPLVSPRELKRRVSVSQEAGDGVLRGRSAVMDILDGKDARRLLIVGPCSIHDLDDAREYARRLKDLQLRVKDRFCIVMRAYFEKARTGLGWQGLVNDPDLNGGGDIAKGLQQARELLAYLAGIGLSAGTEALDPIAYAYLADLVTWTGIGARTAQSQLHRELASGLATPVGFKNSPSGDVDAAIQGVRVASQAHRYLGVDDDGQVAILLTPGNRYAHVVLRGGAEPNYDKKSVVSVLEDLRSNGMRNKIVVDCSHANSQRDQRRQVEVFRNVVAQMRENPGIAGAMLESYLFEGNQEIPPNLRGFKRATLQPGVSVTDACIGWEETERLVLEAAEALAKS